MQADEADRSSFWNAKIDETLKEIGVFDNRKDLLETSEFEFYARHRSALALTDHYDPFFIGLYIAGRYYRGVWNSLERANYLGKLLHIGLHYNDPEFEETLFYGEGSAGIYFALLHSPHFQDIRAAFDRAAKIDDSRLNL